jgi:chromate reductase, NAD(P)H dehydrogenase (quinone)
MSEGGTERSTQVLALCGSLRAASINAALLRAAARLAPPHVSVTLYAGVKDLPLFNPDLEPAPPASVRALRQALAAADALLIASPEYAHGLSGSLKNALDWLVSFEPFVAKPVAVLNASPRAHHAHEALIETLTTMSAQVVREGCIALPLLGSGLDEAGMVADPQVSAALRAVLQRLQAVGGGSAGAANFPVG